jgi:hypothetical protein
MFIWGRNGFRSHILCTIIRVIRANAIAPKNQIIRGLAQVLYLVRNITIWKALPLDVAIVENVIEYKALVVCVFNAKLSTRKVTSGRCVMIEDYRITFPPIVIIVNIRSCNNPICSDI